MTAVGAKGRVEDVEVYSARNHSKRSGQVAAGPRLVL